LYRVSPLALPAEPRPGDAKSTVFLPIAVPALSSMRTALERSQAEP